MNFYQIPVKIYTENKYSEVKKMISNQNKLMLKILSNSLHKIKSEPIGMSDWTAVSKELIDQSVLAITSDSINLEKTDENEKILNLQKTTRTIQIIIRNDGESFQSVF